jgi:TPR repeat protein
LIFILPPVLSIQVNTITEVYPAIKAGFSKRLFNHPVAPPGIQIIFLIRVKRGQMKNIFPAIIIVLFFAASALCGEFEDILKAAEQGDVNAQFNLGWMYAEGRGVPQNYKQAVYWYSRAARQGDASAQFNLGMMYDNGEGVAQDYQQAAHWYAKAAEQGIAVAQYNLGIMYDSGQGVVQSFQQAYLWLSLAAAQGLEEALETRDVAAEKLSPLQLAQARDLAAKMQYQIDHPPEPL